MIYTLELAHPELVEYKIFVDGKLKQEDQCRGSATIRISATKHKIEIWFSPWKIRPLLRINNILIDTATAGVDVFDHKFDMLLDQDFFQRYHRREIDFRTQAVFGDEVPESGIYDRVIGYGSRHDDLVQKIRSRINV